MTIKLYAHKSSTYVLPRFAVVLLLLLNAFSASADWPNANTPKWIQYPDPKGLDVLAGQPPAVEGPLPLIIADDFECRNPGPITDIHIWASWFGDNATPNVPIPITLSIWTDFPTNAANPFSHPGSLLWHQTFLPTQYKVRAVQTANETFWDPGPPPKGTILGPDHIIYQYNFVPTDPFYQQGSDANPTTYWLAVSAGTNTGNFGWKTTATNHWKDDAVWGHVQFDGYNAIGDWLDMHDPRDTSANPQSLDMAFVLTTTNEPPPPPPPVDKWHQLPDLNGFDINATRPNIVADDFWCTNAGVLTNIQIWGSWKDNAAPYPGTIFVLSIWNDVGGSPSTATPPFSRPGSQPIWTETFAPGTYTMTPAGTGNELFYSPTTGQLSPENNIYLYNFVPKNPFCQKGGPPPGPPYPMTYWLSVQAILPSGIPPFGWKTSTNRWKDDGAYGHTAAGGGPTTVFDWKDLHDPRPGTGNPSLSMAFRILNGPPTPDCDPHSRPKWVRWPDVTPNGLDVFDTEPKVLADDFLCKVTGPISGIRVWGSWLADLVDTNAIFQLGLWTDVQPQTGTGGFSHPGQLLCSNIFYPPQAIGTSLQRYNYSMAANNLQENFYDPEKPFPPFMGNDTQIWQYDFYPFQPSCWIQRGGDATFAGGLTYWLSVSCLPADPSKFFGWKTTTNHWQDDAVWGHLTSTLDFVRDWKDLHDPRNGISLDLSFALRAFPITGKNEDILNRTTSVATGIRVVIAGIHEVTWHYDDSPTAWPNFDVTFSGGNTILTWSGKSVGVNSISHVGFEMGGSGPPVIISQSWLGSGGAVIGPAYQLNYHYLGNATTGGAVLILNNDIVNLPIRPANGSVEFFLDPPGLDQMNPQGNRNPLAVLPLDLPAVQIQPGSLMRAIVPPGPPQAMYALFIMNLMDAQGQMQGMDFVLIPLDMALRPIVHGADLLPGALNLRWFSIPDRTYHVESITDLNGPRPHPWSQVSLPDLNGTGDELNATVPVGSDQGYYRVVLDPQ
jgi:hypothetical protein